MTSSLATGVQGSYYSSADLVTTGGAGPATWSVVSGSLPPGITLSSDGQLNGTPTSPGHYSFTVEATDSASPTPDVAAQGMSLTVAPGPPLVIDQSTLPSSTAGSYYYAPVVASGGVGSYTWSVASGSLPEGLTIQTFGGYGYLTGTPTQSGVFNFSLGVTDSGTPSPSVATQAFTLTVGAPGPLQVVTTVLTPGSQGTSYYSYLQASGGVGPYTWTVTSGSLPAGLTLDASGNLSGEPLATGTFSFTVQATDSAVPMPAMATGAVSVVIDAAGPLEISATTLSPATEGTFYSAPLVSSGGIAPLSWSISSGALPPGLTLELFGDTAYVYGTPTVTGAYTFSVQVTDSASPTPTVSTLPLSLLVSPPTPLQVTTTVLDPGTQGVFYENSVQASGGIGPYTWSAPAGDLPDGLTLNPAGYLSGYPTVSGSFAFTAEVTDSSTPAPMVASAKVSVVLAGAAPLSITSPSTLEGTEGLDLGTGLVASGGIGPYTWSKTAGALPSGVSLSSTGYLIGTPAQSGVYTFTATVTDSTTPTPLVQSASFSLRLTGPDPLQVTSSILAEGTQGSLYQTSLEATGGVPQYTWSVIAGALPNGLTLSTSGILSGYPTGTGQFNFTVGVVDSATPTPFKRLKQFRSHWLRRSRWS